MARRGSLLLSLSNADLSEAIWSLSAAGASSSGISSAREAVHTLFEVTPAQEWPASGVAGASSNGARSKVVFIGRNLDRAALQKGIDFHPASSSSGISSARSKVVFIGRYLDRAALQKASKVVFIGRNLDRAALQKGLSSCVADAGQ
ncbi:hypothetical protein T484DRAFT_1803027 [Baffinella frigidus]|nr:hypothetical protein T484DRAFT_1803027 [Cryptophyta sp. CCMP2293]